MVHLLLTLATFSLLITLEWQMFGDLPWVLVDSRNPQLQAAIVRKMMIYRVGLAAQFPFLLALIWFWARRSIDHPTTR
jgi:hypothetical protein